MKQIIVIGGGAAGLAAAISAARSGADGCVTILEGLEQVGKKILVTGNGRCNLGNRQISPAHYHSTDPQHLEQLLEQMPAPRTLDFFDSLGLFWDEEDEGRIYPYCHQAGMVAEVLQREISRLGIRAKCGDRVLQLTKDSKQFQIQTMAGKHYSADAVILTTGGKAAPKQGGTGDGYRFAKNMGHRYHPLTPRLVALKSSHPALKGLKGVRAHCAATLYLDGVPVHTEPGELQFTDYGLSGIPAMQLSCLLSGQKAEVGVDLLPYMASEILTKLLTQRCQQHPSETLDTALAGLIHSKLLSAVFCCAGTPGTQLCKAASPQMPARIAEAMKDWRFAITGTMGWDQAQVTGGGIYLDEIDTQFASRKTPGLYLAGEILDVVGDCGGYNLHWAWCSGMIAGHAAATD